MGGRHAVESFAASGSESGSVAPDVSYGELRQSGRNELAGAQTSFDFGSSSQHVSPARRMAAFVDNASSAARSDSAFRGKNSPMFFSWAEIRERHNVATGGLGCFSQSPKVRLRSVCLDNGPN